jgi:hypothetical protein
MATMIPPATTLLVVLCSGQTPGGSSHVASVQHTSDVVKQHGRESIKTHISAGSHPRHSAPPST